MAASASLPVLPPPVASTPGKCSSRTSGVHCFTSALSLRRRFIPPHNASQVPASSAPPGSIIVFSSTITAPFTSQSGFSPCCSIATAFTSIRCPSAAIHSSGPTFSIVQRKRLLFGVDYRPGNLRVATRSSAQRFWPLRQAQARVRHHSAVQAGPATPRSTVSAVIALLTRAASVIVRQPSPAAASSA